MTRENITWKQAITLQRYVKSLLRDGKRSQHPDFQTLFRLYGQDRIVTMAKQALEEIRDEDAKRGEDVGTVGGV